MSSRPFATPSFAGTTFLGHLVELSRFPFSPSREPDGLESMPAVDGVYAALAVAANRSGWGLACRAVRASGPVAGRRHVGASATGRCGLFQWIARARAKAVITCADQWRRSTCLLPARDVDVWPVRSLLAHIFNNAVGSFRCHAMEQLQGAAIATVDPLFLLPEHEAML